MWGIFITNAGISVTFNLNTNGISEISSVGIYYQFKKMISY